MSAFKSAFTEDLFQLCLKIRSPDPSYYYIKQGTVIHQVTCSQLHKKAEKIAQLLFSAPLPTTMNNSSHGNQPSSSYMASTGDHVALLFYPGVELIQAFYGCLYAGLVPVLVRPPTQRTLATAYNTVKMIIEVTVVVFA